MLLFCLNLKESSRALVRELIGKSIAQHVITITDVRVHQIGLIGSKESIADLIACRAREREHVARLEQEFAAIAATLPEIVEKTQSDRTVGTRAERTKEARANPLPLSAEVGPALHYDPG